MSSQFTPCAGPLLVSLQVPVALIAVVTMTAAPDRLIAGRRVP
jgi:hypothetical protein